MAWSACVSVCVSICVGLSVCLCVWLSMCVSEASEASEAYILTMSCASTALPVPSALLPVWADDRLGGGNDRLDGSEMSHHVQFAHRG